MVFPNSYHLKKLFIFTLLFGIILTVYIYNTFIYVTKSFNSALGADTNQTENSKNSSQFQLKGFNASYTFREVKGAKMYSFYNVCIETRSPPMIRSPWGTKETQKVVIYRGLSGHVTFERSNISVAGSGNTDWNHWELFFTNASIPSSHTLLPTTAFFVSETIPDNLYHVWRDLFLPLFSLVRDTNRLHPGMHNQILYRNPRSDVNLSDPVCKFCRRSPYDILQDTLHTTKKYLLFYELPTNTCYSSAVFGVQYSGTRQRDAVDYVLKELKLSYKPHSKNKRLLIIKRRNRRILNIYNLAKEAKRVGFKKVIVIDLELMTVLEQMKMIIDTDILIGVQGAALQWGIFMRPGSTVIEISWPKKYWISVYSSLRDYEIKFVSLITNEVFVNWNEYEKRFQTVISTEERKRMLKSPPRSFFYYNIWKFADITVNVKIFRASLKTLL